MEKYEIFIKEFESKAVIVQINGYFNQDTGIDIHNNLLPYFEKNYDYIIFDFSNCYTINSPGLGELFQLTLKIVEELRINLYILGLDRLKQSVFRMVGIFNVAKEAKSIDEILKSLK